MLNTTSNLYEKNSLVFYQDIINVDGIGKAMFNVVPERKEVVQIS
jgi:hypothetical protein